MNVYIHEPLQPEGMEWQEGRCPNVGNPCHCVGACAGKWVPLEKHNHMTRDIKAKGKCPRCDQLWAQRLVKEYPNA